MIKTILSIEGVNPLSKSQQSIIFGGIDKCCIQVPTNGFDEDNNKSWCNSYTKCCNSKCACPKNKC